MCAGQIYLHSLLSIFSCNPALSFFPSDFMDLFSYPSVLEVYAALVMILEKKIIITIILNSDLESAKKHFVIRHIRVSARKSMHISGFQNSLHFGSVNKRLVFNRLCPTFTRFFYDYKKKMMCSLQIILLYTYTQNDSSNFPFPFIIIRGH